MESLDSIAVIAATLRGHHTRSWKLSDISDKLLRILANKSFPTVIYEHAAVFCRSRICRENTGYDNLRDLIYPPKPSTSFGRASLPNRHVFYGSLNKGTAMEEIDVATGMLVQSIMFRPKEGHRIALLAIGEAQAVAANGRSRVCGEQFARDMDLMMNNDRDKFQEFLYADSFLAEMFSRPTAKDYEYAVSASAAEIIYQGSHIGLLFPSVRRHQGWNVAMTREYFDEHCEVVAVSEERVRKVYEYGIYDPEIVRVATHFDPDGRIAWEKFQEFHSDWSIQDGVQLPEHLKGWSPC